MTETNGTKHAYHSPDVSPDELGHLLSLVSHEVRAPLGVIRGYMRLLQQQATELSEQHRQALAASLRAAERAAEIINQVSALARLHRREVALSPKPTLLEPLLRAAIHEVVMPGDPVVTIHVGDVPAVPVVADEPLLRTALVALTTAVVRAQSSDNRVHLVAREEQRDNLRGLTLTISSADAKSEDDDRPLDIMRGGLGLDLPVAAFIVDSHGGQVREQRANNRLTGFSVWVPQGGSHD